MREAVRPGRQLAAAAGAVDALLDEPDELAEDDDELDDPDEDDESAFDSVFDSDFVEAAEDDAELRLSVR